MRPLPLSALGRCSVGAVVWRQWGQLFLTAIVKATFALVPEGRMVLVDPDPLFSAEQPEPSGHGLHAAAELAPYLGQVDVWLTGHAEVPPRYAEPALHIWLAVVQQGAVRVDKRVDLYAAVQPADPHPQVEIHGLDPISQQWPVRRRLLGRLDPQRLEAPIIELPGAFDWRYYHTVPADQRLEAITGDEWIVLGGVLLRRPRLRTQLPAARGVARLYRRDAAAPREGAEVALRADMIEIDVDRMRCAIVWRGHVPIGSEAELEGLYLAGAVEAPGEAIDWPDPFAAPPRVAPTLSDEESPLEHTVAIPEGIEGVLAGEALAGEARAEEAVEEPEEREPTMVLDLEALSSGTERSAGARPATTAELAPAAELLAGQRAALPFIPAPPQAEVAAALVAAAPAPAAGGTRITADVPEDLPPAPSLPFRRSAPPPAPAVPEAPAAQEDEAPEDGLGAEFLAAMADAGEGETQANRQGGREDGEKTG